MINCTDPDFTPLGKPQSFPNTTLKNDGYGFNESNCHMLSLCMKVSAGSSANHALFWGETNGTFCSAPKRSAGHSSNQASH